MDKSVLLTDDEKWFATIACDKSSDGQFFYGVKTTKIFCRPSCRAKSPLRENVVFFNSSTDALEAGYRSCKKCRPDMLIYEPDLELVNKLKEIFNQNYDQTICLSAVSQQLGVSASHLIRLFKQYIGLTPAQYILRLRLDKAIELIEQTEINITEIAYMTGFRSISSFYKYFKLQTSRKPNDYR
ncbi:bifunctional transcriptional activator/DNA repair enzyme AdaA [Dendrosporobacter sp. 1207_IL3150]|uniref:bifunctional transcriptional activator/DNA repair enzyme AdaA n=1 Tax=Dendrosporobacter sp. 1207_IL3150 TaxID=3084054 RepID=UPI002FD9EC2B